MQDALRRFEAGIFQALANPTRIAIVELLRDEEASVSRVHKTLGIGQANASQHLAVLRGKNIVVARKEGNQVLYSLRNQLLGQVLDTMKKYFQAHLSEVKDLLSHMDKRTVKR
jgi:DNA-binding transcriptional ArsR family regulator